MSTQIAVRLPDEMVAFVDDLVARGDAASRAEVVARALKRERRRQEGLRDAKIYAAIRDDDDDLDALAAWSARQPRPELD